MSQDKNEIKNWKSYNHAIIPTCAPHEEISPFDANELFKTLGGVLLRYTSEFDCGFPTNWWYLIKDTKFDILSLKAKRRYEITKGTKNFSVEIIRVEKLIDALYDLQVEAAQAYPKKYRAKVERDSFERFILNDLCSENALVYGAFSRENGELCGYAYIQKGSDDWNFRVLKTKPRYEKLGVNAAIIYQILLDFNKEKEANPKLYIYDGERSVIHETAFQDYLEKYFAFRKAYCKLHIIYNRKYKLIIKIAYIFRKILLKLDGIGLIHKLNGIIKMEEIVRGQSKSE